MNPKLLELFNLFKNLRSMQVIVNEIYTVDYYVYNFDKGDSASVIDFCVNKYNKEIKQIGALYGNKVVVEDDKELYNNKYDVEVNEDCA